MASAYRVGEFASRTGVTVRTLHHYDHIGLLQPSTRSEAGYRLYGEPELLRLQQVLTLRQLGFSLGQIAELLARPDFDLEASMRLQRRALLAQIDRLKKTEASIGLLLDRRLETGVWDWDLVLAASSAVVEEINEKDRQMDTNFTPEQMEQAKRLADSLPEGYIEDVEGRWTALIDEIKQNLDADPTTDAARALAQRWNELSAETMKAWNREPALAEKIAEGYETGAFSDNPRAPSPEIFAFIERVNAANT